MNLNLESTDNVTWICSGDEGCWSTEIWCPSDSVGVCSLSNVGTDSDSFQGATVYVDESYTYEFLDIECAVNGSCSNVNVKCEGDKDINTESLRLTSDDEYYCIYDGASRCCPFGNCSVFNDPAMGFDSDLLNISRYFSAVDLEGDTQYLTANITAQLLQSTNKCHRDLCIVRCLNLLSCAFTTAVINSTETIIECDGQFSCVGATIIADAVSVNSLKVLCLGLCSHRISVLFLETLCTLNVTACTLFIRK